ncbi:hypothetical protein MMPV_007018 [Pyropia vietnamensis]
MRRRVSSPIAIAALVGATCGTTALLTATVTRPSVNAVPGPPASSWLPSVPGLSSSASSLLPSSSVLGPPPQVSLERTTSVAMTTSEANGDGAAAPAGPAAASAPAVDVQRQGGQIYHLACPASPVHYKYNAIRTLKTGVLGTLNMLGLAKRVGATFLLASTSEVYGDPLAHPRTEEYWGNVNPIGRVGETMAFDYHRQHGVDIRVVRIFNTYGPRMVENDGRVVSNFVGQALRGRPLTVYGDGSQTRSFCYVADLVDGIIRMMNSNHTGPFNLGNPGEFSMLELAQLIKDQVDPNRDITYLPATPDDPTKRKPDISKATAHLGWTPQVPLKKGLPSMIADFRERIGEGVEAPPPPDGA